MRMKERESLRKMFRTERMKQQMLRGEHIRHRMRNPLQMKSVPGRNVESPIEVNLSPYEKEIESKYEEEELIDINDYTEFDINSVDLSLLSDEFEINQDRAVCPPQITCRNCRDSRYRNCTPCRRISVRCRQRDIRVTRRP